MKGIKLLLLFLAMLLVLPFSVFADEETTEEVSEEPSKEAIVYFFRGDGCPHCQEAEEWFASIEEEYGEYFKIVDYEVWYDESNAALMEKVEKARSEEAGGVPYIIIGEKSWMGFAEEYEEEILDQIKLVYNTEVSQRYDIMKYVESGKSGAVKKNDEKSSGSDALAIILILVIVVGIFFGVRKARETTN